MATVTQTVEETLTFTAKPLHKQMKLKLQKPANVSFDEDKLKQSRAEPFEEPKVDLQLCQPDYSESFEEPKMGLQLCPPDCQDCKRMISQLCPPGCEECKKLKICSSNSLINTNSKTIPLVFNAFGIMIAILATYMIVSTDSSLYLVFWVVYSVLRRMMTKSKPRVKTE